MQKSKLIFFLLILVGLGGCKTVLDPSMEAYAAGDFTLVGALSEGGCGNIPAGGADVCRVKEGAVVETVWRLVVPEGRSVVSGHITVYWKDISKVYSLKGQVVEVPFRDLLGRGTWAKADTSVATALGEIRWKDQDGLERVARAEGMAIIIVLKRGYDPMPIDSGTQNWSTKCKVQYSTAGRSALKCD